VKEKRKKERDIGVFYSRGRRRRGVFVMK